MSTYNYNDLPRNYKEKIMCAHCQKLDMSNKKKDYNGKETFYCKEKRKYVKLGDKICPSVIIDRKVANSYGGYRPSGFYIATAILNIIKFHGKEEMYHTDFVEENINKFFTEELEKNITCYDLLLEYDTVAPELAMMLEISPNSFEYATYLYNLYLLPVAISVAQGQIEDALKMYIRMVYEINNKFNTEPLEMDDTKNYHLHNELTNDLQMTLEEYYGEDLYKERTLTK